MRSPSPLLRNATSLLLAQVVTKVVNVLVSVALVRVLGSEELGRYAYVLAFAAPFGAITDFGLTTLAIREIARDRDRTGLYVRNLRVLLLGLGVASAAAMLATALAVGHRGPILLALLLAGAAGLVAAAGGPFLVALSGHEELHLVAGLKIAGSLIGSVILLIPLLSGGGMLGLLLAAVVGNALTLGITARVARHLPTAGTSDPALCRSLLRQAIPFACLMVSFALYYRTDMVLLKWFRGDREAGLYAAAYKFVDGALVLVSALGGPFYPRFALLYGKAEEEFRQLLQGTWRPMLALALPGAAALSILAPEMVRWLFGPEYSEAASAVRVLVWAAIPLFCINIPNHALNASNQVWPLAGIYGTTATVNIGLNLVAIPALGALGAAGTTVFSECLNLGLVYRLVRRRFAVRAELEGIWRYLLSTGLMVATLLLARGWPLPVLVAVAAGSYGIGLMATGFARSGDLKAMKRLVFQ